MPKTGHTGRLQMQSMNLGVCSSKRAVFAFLSRPVFALALWTWARPVLDATHLGKVHQGVGLVTQLPLFHLDTSQSVEKSWNR